VSTKKNGTHGKRRGGETDKKGEEATRERLATKSFLREGLGPNPRGKLGGSREKSNPSSRQKTS